MKAYCVVQEAIDDEANFAIYRQKVMATIAAHGGSFIVRGGSFAVLEGEWSFPRLVIIEFPSRAAADAWYRSPEYQSILPLRLKSARGNLVIVDGVE